MAGRLIALDETCVRVNGLEYWVYVAVDVDGGEVLSMRVYPSRNILTTKIHTEALNYCIGKYLLLMMLHGLTELEELGSTYNIESLQIEA